MAYTGLYLSVSALLSLRKFELGGLRNLINIDKVEFNPVISLKRHVPIPESYGSLTIYAQDKKYYMDEVEDVEEVYEVIKAYVNNKKELM